MVQTLDDLVVDLCELVAADVEVSKLFSIDESIRIVEGLDEVV